MCPPVQTPSCLKEKQPQLVLVLVEICLERTSQLVLNSEEKKENLDVSDFLMETLAIFTFVLHFINRKTKCVLIRTTDAASTRDKQTGQLLEKGPKGEVCYQDYLEHVHCCMIHIINSFIYRHGSKNKFQ